MFLRISCGRYDNLSYYGSDVLLGVPESCSHWCSPGVDFVCSVQGGDRIRITLDRLPNFASRRCHPGTGGEQRGPFEVPLKGGGRIGDRPFCVVSGLRTCSVLSEFVHFGKL